MTTKNPCSVCAEPLTMTDLYDCAACGATPGERLKAILDRMDAAGRLNARSTE